MIYFIQDSATSRIKIGFAEDPWKRLSKIQSDSPSDVRILALEEGDLAREAELHQKFEGDWQRGEWFAPSAPLLSHIGKLPVAMRPTTHTRSRSFWNGMTAADVAAKLGVAKSTISTIQSGQRRPSPELAVRIQALTGLCAIKLVFGDLLDELQTGKAA